MSLRQQEQLSFVPESKAKATDGKNRDFWVLGDAGDAECGNTLSDSEMHFMQCVANQLTAITHSQFPLNMKVTNALHAVSAVAVALDDEMSDLLTHASNVKAGTVYGCVGLEMTEYRKDYFRLVGQKLIQFADCDHDDETLDREDVAYVDYCARKLSVALVSAEEEVDG